MLTCGQSVVAASKPDLPSISCQADGLASLEEIPVRDPERPSSGLSGHPGLGAGRVLQPRAPLRKVARVQLPHGAHAAVQRPERSGEAQRHRGARLHETDGRVRDLLGQRRGLEDPLAGKPGAGRGTTSSSKSCQSIALQSLNSLSRLNFN